MYRINLERPHILPLVEKHRPILEPRILHLPKPRRPATLTALVRRDRVFESPIPSVKDYATTARVLILRDRLHDGEGRVEGLVVSRTAKNSCPTDG